MKVNSIVFKYFAFDIPFDDAYNYVSLCSIWCLFSCIYLLLILKYLTQKPKNKKYPLFFFSFCNNSLYAYTFITQEKAKKINVILFCLDCDQYYCYNS